MARGFKVVSMALGFTLVLALASWPPAGAGTSSPAPAEMATDPDEEDGRQGRSYQDSALFIAGLSNPEGSLREYEENQVWRRYSRLLQQSWEAFLKRQGHAMKSWAAQELGEVHTDTVFYPFSGPDLVHLHRLFPRARTYLMIALEPVGELPDFAALNLGGFFARLHHSLGDVLHLSFFMTKKMAASLGRQEMKGVLPILLFFLAREQAEVLEVRHWVMKPDGSVEEYPASFPGKREGGIQGVRIVFTEPGSDDKRTLYYFQFNLSNPSWEKNRHFVDFLQSFGPFTTFTKAASYLMFHSHFDGIRRFILEHSRCVLQSDSGIPLKYFDRSQWELRFYGTYRSPITLFSHRRQAELAEIFRKKQEVRPLPFGICYHHRMNTSNLILATRKAIHTADGSP